MRFKMRWLLRSKIHKATVTDANVEYIGSLEIDQDLLGKIGLWPGEKVLVSSLDTGERLETYVISAKRGSGIICMNGAAAHVIKQGEQVIIMGFELSDQPIESKVILVDEKNQFVRYL